MMTGLTLKQNKALGFISGYISENGVSPSYDDISRAMGWNSKSGVHRVVLALEERNAIRRLKNRKRSIVVLSPTAVPSAIDVLFRPETIALIRKAAAAFNLRPEVFLAEIVHEYLSSLLKSRAIEERK